MHKKLIALLRTLSGTEQEKMLKFVQSPYFNEREDLSQLLVVILSFSPTFDASECSPAAVFSGLFPHRVFDKTALNKLNSSLFQLAEQFIVQEQLQQDPFEQLQLSLQFYTRKRLERHFEAKMRQVKSNYAKLKQGDPRRARNQLTIEKQLAEWMITQDTRMGDVNLQSYNNALDEFFLLEKLSLLNAMIGRQKIINWAYEFSWTDEILAHLSTNDYPDWPAIGLLKQVLLLQKEPDQPQHYFQLKRLLKQQAQHFPAMELRGFFTYLENAAKNIFPISGYFEELFALYQEQLELGVLFQHGKIHHTLFKNIVLTGLELGHFGWIATFIKDHHGKIIPLTFRKDAYFQNLANLHYYQKEYLEAQQLLLQTNPTDIYYKLSQKSLLARIYFENKELEVLNGFTNTFTKFIFDQKKKIAPAKVESYRLFVNFLRKLCHLIEDHPDHIDAFNKDRPLPPFTAQDKLQQLKAQLDASPVFYSKKWLLERVERM